MIYLFSWRDLSRYAGSMQPRQARKRTCARPNNQSHDL